MTAEQIKELQEELAHANARLKQARDVLMEAQPLVKARLCDMERFREFPVDESILGRIEEALEP